MICENCGRRFRARLFDPEMQLMAAGWRKLGDTWRCIDCTVRPPAPRGPRPVTTCLECNASFGVAFASDEQKAAKGWVLMGDRWVCPACVQAIREENG
jgi:rubredoxin